MIASPPLVYLDTALVATGSTLTVGSGGDLQGALNTANPGDTITLAAGGTFQGPFTLPAKSGSGWITVQSAALASLPAPGVRVSPAQAGSMPKVVVASGVGGAIQTAPGAHHFRFVGIEFAPTSGQYVYAVVDLGTGITSMAGVPHDLQFDRCYIHGDPAAGA